jgi:hypothetical protein
MGRDGLRLGVAQWPINRNCSVAQFHQLERAIGMGGICARFAFVTADVDADTRKVNWRCECHCLAERRLAGLGLELAMRFAR